MAGGRQLSFMPEHPDEDGDQMDLLEEAGTEVLQVGSIDLGVLGQPCRNCGARPGQLCVSIRDGISALNDFHRARPDGYDEEAR
jgi:hypothetical protein